MTRVEAKAQPLSAAASTSADERLTALEQQLRLALEEVADLRARDQLNELYSKHTVDARQADAKAGNENASNAFRRGADAWRAYRDAECARRPAGDERKACMVEHTRRRALDLR